MPDPAVSSAHVLRSQASQVLAAMLDFNTAGFEFWYKWTLLHVLVEEVPLPLPAPLKTPFLFHLVLGCPHGTQGHTPHTFLARDSASHPEPRFSAESADVGSCRFLPL